MTGHHDDDRFDRAMRELHRESLAHLGDDTRRRLRAVRATAAAAPARRPGWPLASAAAALCVLALSLTLRPPPASSPAAGPGVPEAPRDAPAAGSAAIASNDSEPAMLTALEESPDFYLWLASNEAAPDALE